MTVKELKPIEIDLWEPAQDKPGWVQQTGRKSIQQVYNELVEYLKAADVRFDELEYFDVSVTAEHEHGLNTPFPAYRWIACYPVRGGCEGYYIHVDVLTRGRSYTIFLGKTLYEGDEGFSRAAAVANACAKALQA